jgi:hypothetical protein
MHWAPTSDPEYKRYLVSASQDGRLIVWNGLTGNKVRTPHPLLAERCNALHDAAAYGST